MSDRPAVAVFGAGAVGCYFGGMLARSGIQVTLIGRPSHMDAINREGLLLDGLHLHERVRLFTSSEPEPVGHSQIVLLCVKTVDTETAARTIQPYLSANAIILSLQNGVDNVDRIYRATNIKAIPSVVYVACAMVAPGHVKHSGRGDLIIGNPWDDLAGSPAGDGKATNLERIAEIFERAAVPCRISSTIKTELWIKMIMNCAYNAISALGRSRYGRLMDSPQIRDLMVRVIQEAVAVARADGVPLSEATMIDAAFQLGKDMSGARSSTAQDIDRSKPTEIDSLNGYVVRRGMELGVHTPVNETLFALVKLLEQSVISPAAKTTS